MVELIIIVGSVGSVGSDSKDVIMKS